MNIISTVLAYILGFVLVVALIFTVPWLTFIAIQRVTDGAAMGISGWFSAFWLILLFGGGIWASK